MNFGRDADANTGGKLRCACVSGAPNMDVETANAIR